MVIDSEVTSDIVNEILALCYSEFKKKNNRKKIRYIISRVSNYVFNQFKIQFFIILSILILMFVMNCVQFYFYIFHFQKFILYQTPMSVGALLGG
jgi:hypothetical protein